MNRDMMVRPGDIDQIKSIWRLSFGDSDEYIDNFLKMMFKQNNAIVSREDGRVVSVAFLLDTQMIIDKRPYSAYYFYAAATHPDYRGKGHMAKVLEEAEMVSIERGIDFLVLVPAEKSLFEYYRGFGYDTAFYKRVAHFTRNEISELATEPDLSDAFKLDIFETRQTSLGLYDFLNWGAESLKYALFEHNSGTGSVAFTSDGYAIYNMGKDTLYVKEICSVGDPGEVLTMLLMEDEAEYFTFNLPVDSPIHSFKEEVVEVGMILPLSDRAKPAKKQINNGYIGITLG